jgi:EpsD family peptidyl-prolyl cis-trans isomerase
MKYLILVTVLIFGLEACSSKDAEKPASQIAAKVNTGEISVHQINYILSRTPSAANTPEAAAKLRREILNRLIDQELAVEQAVESKLDRSPDILMAIENAKREILARAYVDQIASRLNKPTIEEAKKYYIEHPQLFAERRIYNIQEIVLPASNQVADQLRELLEGGKSMEEIANWLKSKDIKFAAGSATRPAEQIPLELLPKIHPLKTGQGMILQSPQSITVMRLAASQSVPVSEDVALPRIQQFLGNQRASEAAKEEFKSLKAKAKITYMGEFGETNTGAVSQAQTAPVPPTGRAPDANVQKSAVEKGVAGLK